LLKILFIMKKCKMWMSWVRELSELQLFEDASIFHYNLVEDILMFYFISVQGWTPVYSK
jgi:hypothetical protein